MLSTMSLRAFTNESNSCQSAAHSLVGSEQLETRYSLFFEQCGMQVIAASAHVHPTPVPPAGAQRVEQPVVVGNAEFAEQFCPQQYTAHTVVLS